MDGWMGDRLWEDGRSQTKIGEEEFLIWLLNCSNGTASCSYAWAAGNIP
jgi:hypothetical protein